MTTLMAESLEKKLGYQEASANLGTVDTLAGPSQRTKHQWFKTTRTVGDRWKGEFLSITAEVRFDDRCGNGHNTFAITADMREFTDGRKVGESGGCLHEEIAKHFPELEPLIKWHLCSTDGPLHYIANTVYIAGDRDCWGKSPKPRELDAARHSAIWPEATDEQLSQEPEALTRDLKERLPALLNAFRSDMEKLGFIW